MNRDKNTDVWFGDQFFEGSNTPTGVHLAAREVVDVAEKIHRTLGLIAKIECNLNAGAARAETGDARGHSMRTVQVHSQSICAGEANVRCRNRLEEL